LERLRLEITELEAEKIAVHTSKEQLEEAHSAASASVERLQQETDQWQMRAATLEKELELIQGCTKDSEVEAAGRLAEAQAKCEDLRAKIAELEVEKRAAEISQEKLQEAHASTSASLEQLQQESDQWQKRAAKSDKELELLQNRVKELEVLQPLQERVAELEQANVAMEEERAALLGMKDAMSLELEALRTFRDTAMELEQGKSAMDEEMASLRDRATELEQGKSAMAEEIAGLRDRAIELEQGKAAAADESAGLRDRVNGLEQSKSAMADEITVLRDRAIELEQAKSAKSAMAEEIDALRNKAIALEQTKSAMAEEIAGFRDKVIDLEQGKISMAEKIAGLENSKDTLQKEVEKLRPLEERVEELQQEVKRSAKTAMLQEVETSECEKQRAQIKELSVTMQNYKQENEALVVENCRLSESLAIFEEDLDKVSHRNAQLIGHVNPKQKLRYTLKLKDEKNQLRVENDKLRSRLLQLEGSRRSESLFEALASLGYGGSVGTVERNVTRTPSKKSPEPASSLMRSPQSCAAQLAVPSSRRPSGGLGTEEQLQDTTHRCRVQERALERVNTDFQHLVSLIESAVLGDEARSGGDSVVSFASLLDRLRAMSSAASKNGGPMEPATVGQHFDDTELPPGHPSNPKSSPMKEPHHQYLRKHTGDGGAAVPGVHVYYGEIGNQEYEHVGHGGYHGEPEFEETTEIQCGREADPEATWEVPTDPEATSEVPSWEASQSTDRKGPERSED